ncbi:MAG TPA: hypothetical protein VK178_18400 [Opitutaceae bacterium]|nr:hypothetical protein [Opitutaceae bacterium]
MSAPHPTSVAARPAAPGPQDSTTENLPSSELRRALRDSARLDLYATNACRTLGLFPPVEPASLVERVQALLAEVPAPAWAFAPSLPLSTEQLRRAGLASDQSADRLLAELFWFWPEAYPEQRADAALSALAAGDAETAYSSWLAAGSRGYAAHNMAVMFHYAALGRELEKGPLDEEARSWWNAAAEQWTATFATDDFWTQWSARVSALGLAGSAAEGAAALRTELPQILGTLSLLAAAERARRGELAEARWLREFAVRRLGDGPALGEALAFALAAEWQRAEDCLNEAEERITADDEPCLRHVAEVLRQLATRRRVAESVAGPDSELLRRIGSRTIEVSLAGLVEHARRVPGDPAVLPWLLHLSGWPAGADQRRRATVAVRECWDRLVAAALADGTETNKHEAVLRLCTETLAPAVEQFSWDERAQAAYRQRVVRQLRQLAREAWLEIGEFEVTAQACVLAAELLDEESRTLVVRERRQLFQQFQRAQNGALRLEFGGAVLEIDSRRIQFDGRVWPVAALSGLRFGVAHGLGGEGPQVAWYAGRDAVVLDAVTWFDPANGGAERFRQVVEALDACVVPVIAGRIVERVHDGQSVVFGPSALRPDGFVFQRRPGQLVPDATVPYVQLVQRVESGELVLGRAGDDPAESRYPLAAVWNAVAMPEALARLAETE